MSIRDIAMRFSFRLPYEAEMRRRVQMAKQHIKDLSTQGSIDELAAVQIWLNELEESQMSNLAYTNEMKTK